jgi:O-antigen ligase
VYGLKLGFTTLEQKVFLSDGVVRICSLTSNPNFLGILLVISIISLLSLFFQKKIKTSLFIVFLSILVVALYYTYSRSSWLCLIIMVTIICFLLRADLLPRVQKIIKNIIYIILSFLFVACIILLFTIGNINKRFSLDLNRRIEDAWIPLINMFDSHTLFGVGFNASVDHFFEKYNISHGHNLYLTILAELGLIGGVIFILLLIVMAVLLFNAITHGNFRKKDDFDLEFYVQSRIAFSFFIGLLIHQMFEVNLMRFDYIHIAWLFFVLSIIQMRKIKKNIYKNL